MEMMGEVDIGINRPATLLLKFVEKVLTVMREVDIGLIPVTLPPITQVTEVDFCVYLLLLVVFTKVFIMMKEVIVVVVVV